VLLNTLVKPLPPPTMAQTLLRNYIAPPRVPANRRGPKVEWSVMHTKARMDAGLSLWLHGEFSGTKKNGGLRKFCKEQDLPYSTFFDRNRNQINSPCRQRCARRSFARSLEVPSLTLSLHLTI
jgi:hypothetical protein